MKVSWGFSYCLPSLPVQSTSAAKAPRRLSEGLPGISEALIEQHEEAALVAVIATVVLGVLALFGLLFFFRKQLPVGFATVALILALVVNGVMAWTANLGGQINHPEIRSGQVTAQTDGSEQSGTYVVDDDD